jgi:hypothetical protein
LKQSQANNLVGLHNKPIQDVQMKDAKVTLDSDEDVASKKQS